MRALRVLALFLILPTFFGCAIAAGLWSMAYVFMGVALIWLELGTFLYASQNETFSFQAYGDFLSRLVEKTLTGGS
jgi:hypothetical protein